LKDFSVHSDPPVQQQAFFFEEFEIQFSSVLHIPELALGESESNIDIMNYIS
jgi:hypothetical protein